MNSQQSIHVAQQVIAQPDTYPTSLVQAAMLFLLDPDSVELQTLFLDVYQQASTVKKMLVGEGLPFPPDEQTYYEPGEIGKPGAEIGVEPLAGWVLRLFPPALRRHVIIAGMSGSGKTNLLQVLAMGLAELDK